MRVTWRHSNESSLKAPDIQAELRVTLGVGQAILTLQSPELFQSIKASKFKYVPSKVPSDVANDLPECLSGDNRGWGFTSSTSEGEVNLMTATPHTLDAQRVVAFVRIWHT